MDAHRITHFCSLCKKEFRTRGELRSHRKHVVCQKLHSCNMCNATFEQVCYLNRHHVLAHNLEAEAEKGLFINETKPFVECETENRVNDLLKN